jgi:hypothetical protein
MSFFSHNYVKYLTKPCHNDIILLVDALAPIPTPLRGLDKSGRQNLLLAFAARVHTGIYGKGWQVGHQLVKKALYHVAQTLQLVGTTTLEKHTEPKS